MLRWSMLWMLAILLPLRPEATPDGPTYTADGQLKYPVGYPEWVFLGAGLDMSYAAGAKPTDHSSFNVDFVNPSAYRAFQQTGTWPEGTVMVLEVRGAEGAASINKAGKTMSGEVMAVEVHVKDSAHLKGGWGFFGFDEPADTKGTGKLIARPASCYTCHEAHGAVDTTFTQFYPRAFAIARAKGTLSGEYLKETR